MEEEKESQELTAVGNPKEKDDNSNDGGNGGGAGGMLFYVCQFQVTDRLVSIDLKVVIPLQHSKVDLVHLQQWKRLLQRQRKVVESL